MLKLLGYNPIPSIPFTNVSGIAFFIMLYEALRSACISLPFADWNTCIVSHSSGQFAKRIMIQFLPFHLPFVLSYFFPSLIFLPSQSIFLGLFEHYIHNSLLHCRLNYNFLPPKTALSILKINPVSVPEDIKRIRG